MSAITLAGPGHLNQHSSDSVTNLPDETPRDSSADGVSQVMRLAARPAAGRVRSRVFPRSCTLHLKRLVW
jgi:hypothetical protein